MDWLSKPVDERHLDSDFCIAERFVRTVEVVNDTAERGVKLISDFATSITTDPMQQSAQLQDGEHYRRLYPDFAKETLNI